MEKCHYSAKEKKAVYGRNDGHLRGFGTNKGRKRSQVEYRRLATEGMVGCSVARVGMRMGGKDGGARQNLDISFGRGF